MKQFNLVLFLVLLCMCSLTCKFLKNKSRVVKNRINYLKVERQGNLTVSDIGSSAISTWICATNGTILKSSATAVKYILTSKIDGKCKHIDVDADGLPWVINDKGLVYRLSRIVGDSLVWNKVYTPKKKELAIDIGCGQYKGTPCYIAVAGKANPFVFNGNKFVIDKSYDAKSKILRLDVGNGRDGDEITVINENNFVLQLAKGKGALSVGMSGNDVTIGHNNDMYVTNEYGIFYKSKCSNFFTQANELLGTKLTVGNSLWAVGYDNYVYNATISADLNGC
jgi:hypothetical protein